MSRLKLFEIRIDIEAEARTPDEADAFARNAVAAGAGTVSIVGYTTCECCGAWVPEEKAVSGVDADLCKRCARYSKTWDSEAG